VFYLPLWLLLLIIFIILVPTLLTKLKRSQVGLDLMQPAFEQLTETCAKRKAPTLAQITLRLTDTNNDSNDSANIVDWLANGIKTENDQ
jgi:hypothetical protein